MTKSLFPKLAWTSIRKNGKFYFPYLLTILCTVAGFYIIAALSMNSDYPDRLRYEYLRATALIGCVVDAIFSAIFLFYTNSFLMKRRQKELGLYNILGMGKRHIGMILAWESFYTALIGLGGGLLTGTLLYKLVLVLLSNLLSFSVPFGFSVNIKALAATLLVFAFILLLTLLYNLTRIRLSRPIELLRGGNVGEREPRSKWLLALLGAGCLGAGYYIAVTTTSALDALSLYFVAVLLVIIGTYCLFTAVSIVVLKAMRSRKRFYYKANHFISVSGMLYRMKQNAVGLANICILSTMVLVMISGTISLYLGTDDVISARYPADMVGTVSYRPDSAEESFRSEDFLSQIQDTLAQNGYTPLDLHDYHYLTFTLGRCADGSLASDIENAGGSGNAVNLCFLAEADYAAMTGTQPPALSGDEVFLYADGRALPESVVLRLGDATMRFHTAKNLDSFPPVAELGGYATDVYYFVVAGEEVLSGLYNAQVAAYEDMSAPMKWAFEFNLAGADNEETVMACSQLLNDPDNGFVPSDSGSWEMYSISDRATNMAEFYSMNGSFLFLGIYLGLLFILATVLIIYYKQISEGYDDRERFRIMQQVGLTEAEVRRSINAQILWIFFLPLVVAAIHVAFDFNLMLRLLTLFSLSNVRLTALCSLGTLAGFAVIYGLVYLLTSRVYYKIVR